MDIAIGLEIHEQLKTRRKLYCNCPTDYRETSPNSNICPICTSQPGAKPMGINENALGAVVKIALALGCDVLAGESIYVQRKHYFYPDLPSNYQRTSTAVAVNGKLGEVRIREVHFEEDPGRYDLRVGEVDFNRCGVPLVEIITEPDMCSPEDARAFLKGLQTVLGYLDVAREEDGTMRIDANISLEGGTRVEIKNINSFRGVYKALKFEITRQKNLLRRGKAVARETRHYDEVNLVTLPLRKKETVEDYRYIPDPDIPPLTMDRAWIKSIGRELPELPHIRMDRFVEEYGIKEVDARTLVSEKALADLFEKVVQEIDPETVVYWVRNELKRVLNYHGIMFRDTEITPQHMVELLKMVEGGEITVKAGRKILEHMVAEAKMPSELVEELGLAKIEEEEILVRAVEKAIEKNPEAVQDYQSGKDEAIHYLMGRVMKYTRGRADPKIVRRKLKEKLEAF